MEETLLTLVFQTGFALPVEEASFTVKNAAGEVVGQGAVTPSSSGISEPVLLAAPPRALSLTPDSTELPYATYTVECRAAGFYDAVVRGVQVFSGESARQTVNLLPLPRSGRARRGALVYEIGEHALRQSVIPRQVSGEGRILERVVVPETITVHLGAPNSFAQNVTVPFVDYIKNVASSEIYPTWPEESLRANILAQVSLALNRIYTEWYPARGYTFNITNSTAYDQYFVYGRNIFDSVSRLADELFSTYLVKEFREEPFYAEYCNGSTVSCPGMSQWGTVALAEDGFDDTQILRFYYGEIQKKTTDNVAAIPESYPGSPLTLGSSGDAVLTLQIQLDRIAINYPAIPLVFADGVFGANTQAAVRAFQRIAALTADGIVGRATWYAVSHYYVAVKKLAELASEGELPSYNDFAFPGILKRQSRGTSVQTVQFFLNTLAAYNPEIPTQKIDGIFGAATERAVQDFQRFYGLVADGIVGEATWELLVDAYRGIQNVPVPPEELVVRPYPGTLVRRGNRGENVRYVQTALALISETFVQIARPAVDGVFGGNTETAVRTFQRIFGLVADGIVGSRTWDALGRVAVACRECLFQTGEASYTRPYPGALVRRGNRGENVRYVQTALVQIRREIPSLPALTVDGVFGAATEGAVLALQRTFGLAADGIVGRVTWEEINFLLVAVTEGCLFLGERQAPSAHSGSDLPSVPTASPVSAPRTLRLGVFGEDVREMKALLSARLGLSPVALGEDLLFGLSCRRALERFQLTEGLPPTGEADEETLRRLKEKQA